MTIEYTSFDAEIESRPVFFNQEDHKQVAEIIDAIVYCQFDDELNYEVILKCDEQRFSITTDYDGNEVVVNAQSEEGRPDFRHHIQIIPPAGGFGSHFQVNIVKTIPSGGGFKYSGFDIHAVHRPGIGSEFVAGGGTLDNGWE